MINPGKIKADFPILDQKINGFDLVYMDNAATSQKPKQVIEAISNYYQTANANVHRGVHTLSDKSTTLWQDSRTKIANFFGAETDELIFVRNTTEGINGVAYGWLNENLQPGDVILISAVEHHSNFVVWQQISAKKKAEIILVEISSLGKIDTKDLANKLKHYQNKVKLLAFNHVSNTLGIVQPIAEIVDTINDQTVNWRSRPKLLIDAAQSAPHLKINFDKSKIDFMTISGHKMLGPMGIGILLVKKEILANGEMQPWLYGGGMIASVSHEETLFHDDLSERFTAGTPDVASMVGLAAACDYLDNLGMGQVFEHDQSLVKYALEKLQQVKEVQIVGPMLGDLDRDTQRVGLVTFIYKGVHAHDVAQILDSVGVAVRSGHHCTMPLHKKFGWQATVRASFQVYNSTDDIDKLIDGLKKVKQVFGV